MAFQAGWYLEQAGQGWNAVYLTASPSNTSIAVEGPYPSKAAAEAAAGSTGNTGGSTEPWWVVGKLEGSGMNQEVVNSVIQSATKPQVADNPKPGAIEFVTGPFSTKAAADQAAGIGGAAGNPNPPGTTVTGPSPAGGLSGFLSTLSEGSLWIRVVEVGLGLILIAVGVARLTHAVPIATSVAKTVGAVAI